MLPLLLLAAAAPQTSVVDAERAFAADAQTIGQWTAFHKWSADDATMFVPQPVNAHEFLKDRKDPPKAIDWWPTAAWVSCDGTLAVDTGGWTRPNGSVGYFTTVWRKQKDGSWKWTIDSGDALTSARVRPATPKTAKATCGGKPAKVIRETATDGMSATDSSEDGTLRVSFHVAADKGRELLASLWNGKTFMPVIDDHIAAPPK